MHASALLAVLLAAGPLDHFQKCVGDYVKLHQKVEGQLPRLKPTGNPEVITAHQGELARRLREARPQAKPSEIFTPEVSAEFRRLIAEAMRGDKADRVHQSLRRAEPVRVPLQIGQPYPDDLPLQSTRPRSCSICPSCRPNSIIGLPVTTLFYVMSGRT